MPERQWETVCVRHAARAVRHLTLPLHIAGVEGNAAFSMQGQCFSNFSLSSPYSSVRRLRSDEAIRGERRSLPWSFRFPLRDSKPNAQTGTIVSLFPSFSLRQLGATSSRHARDAYGWYTQATTCFE